MGNDAAKPTATQADRRCIVVYSSTAVGYPITLACRASAPILSDIWILWQMRRTHTGKIRRPRSAHRTGIALLAFHAAPSSSHEKLFLAKQYYNSTYD